METATPQTLSLLPGCKGHQKEQCSMQYILRQLQRVAGIRSHIDPPMCLFFPGDRKRRKEQ